MPDVVLTFHAGIAENLLRSRRGSPMLAKTGPIAAVIPGLDISQGRANCQGVSPVTA